MEQLHPARFGRRLGQAQCTTSLATIYTVPTNRSTRVTSVVMTNTHASDYCTVSVKVGSRYLVYEYSLQPSETLEWSAGESALVMHSAETIQIKSDTATSVDVYASGEEG